MGFREQCAVSVAPIFLRVALGVTFIWAGAGKVFEDAPVKGEDAAILANLGLVDAPPKVAPQAPVLPAPQTAPPAAPSSGPASAPPAPAPAGGPPALLQTVQPALSTTPYTAEDFPNDINVRMVHRGLTLSLVRAAAPADGKMPLWPPALAKDRWPVYFAWAAALTELVGGCWVLLGLFTRFSAFMIAGVMFVAMWLSQFGPAIQSGATYLGFIPKHPLWGVNEGGMPFYGVLMWQLALFCSSMALVFTGAGALAIDRALFGGASPSKPAE